LTSALWRAREAVPEINEALDGKTYFKWTEREAVDAAAKYIDAHPQRDAFSAAMAVDSSDLTYEAKAATKALAYQRLLNAQRAAKAKLDDPAVDLGVGRQAVEYAQKVFREQSDILADQMADDASQAGSQLRAHRLIADLFAPWHWLRLLKRPTVRGRRAAHNKSFMELLDEAVAAARNQASRNTESRMRKLFEAAGRRFLPTDLSAEERLEYEIQQRVAHLVSDPRPIREQIAAAAAQAAALGAVSRIRKLLAGSPQAETLLGRITRDVTTMAREQVNRSIDEVVGKEEAVPVDPTEKIRNAWRELGKLPLAEDVFNAALESIRAYAPDEALLLAQAGFDAARSSAIRKAVTHSLVLADEVRKSLGNRHLTVEALTSALREANPELDPSFRVPGMTDAAYEKLAAAVEAVYNEEVRKAAEKNLESMAKAHRARDLMEKNFDRSTIQKLLPYINMGGLRNDEAYEVLAEKFNLPKWTPEMAAEVEADAEALQLLPQGSIQRDEAAQNLMLKISRFHFEGARSKEDLARNYVNVATAIWTAGVLSGLRTQGVNATATLASVFLESFSQAAAYAWSARGASIEERKKFFGDITRSWTEVFGKTDYGTRRGVLEMEAAVTKGTSKFKSEKQEAFSPLEMFNFRPVRGLMDGGLKDLGANVAATYRFVGRVMLAADAGNSMLADTIKRNMARRALAMEMGMTEEQVQKIMESPSEDEIRVADEMAAAEAAAGHLKSELDIKRRKEQILEGFVNERLGPEFDEEMHKAGRDFAALASFNNDPVGLIGAVSMEIMRTLNFNTLGATKPLMPFAKTMANITNSIINYSPYGYLRAANASLGALTTKGTKYDRNIDRTTRDGNLEHKAMQVRATIGTAAWLILAAIIKAGMDDRREGREPYVELTGSGPKDPEKRKQWLAAGNKPYHLRIGKVQLRYTDWPGFAMTMAAFGTYSDRLVHSDSEGSPVLDVGMAAFGAATSVLDRNMMQGFNTLFKMLSPTAREDEIVGGARSLASSYLGGFTNPSLTREIGQLFTGKVNETRTGDGWLIGQTPLTWFRDKPVLNILGEPVTMPQEEVLLGRFGAVRREHPLLSPLTEAGIYLPVASKFRILDPKTKKPRGMTEGEFYDYSKAFGEAMKAQLMRPGTMESLLRLSPEEAKKETGNMGTRAREAARRAVGFAPAPRR
jgi:hypothetical protein